MAKRKPIKRIPPAPPAESLPRAENELVIRNRQRNCRMDVRFLREIIEHLLTETLRVPCYQLGFHLVSNGEMARVNESFLNHSGPTDVITFDHLESPSGGQLHGEIFICLAIALAQAEEFGTKWPSELVRYVIHGLLHLQGYDDLEPIARRKMKRQEERLLRLISSRFPLSRLKRAPTLTP